MDISLIYHEIKCAEERNVKFTSKCKNRTEAIRVATMYQRLLYQKEKITQKIAELNSVLCMLPGTVWTPTGEKPSEYMAKCQIFAEKEKIVPPPYQFPVFSVWAEQIILDSKKTIFKNDKKMDTKVDFEERIKQRFEQGLSAAMNGKHEESFQILEELEKMVSVMEKKSYNYSTWNQKNMSKPTIKFSRFFSYKKAIKSFIKNENYPPILDLPNKLYRKSEEYFKLYRDRLNKKNDKLLDFMSLASLYLDFSTQGFVGGETVLLQSLGVHLCYLNLYEEAKYYLVQSLALENKNHHSLQWLGDCFRFQEEYDIAILHYNKAIKVLEKNEPISYIDVDNYNSDLGEYYYCLAMAHLGKKEYSKAIDYIIKSKSLKDNNFFGYINEGFRDWDDIVKRIKSIQSKFEAKKNPATEDYEDTLNEISLVTGEFSQLLSKNKELNTVVKKLPYFEFLTQKSKEFIKSAELMYYVLPDNVDFSTVMVQYCKIVETEMFYKFIKKLEIYVLSKSLEIQTGPDRKKDINNFNRVFLGNYIHLLKNKIVKKFVYEHYPNHKEFLLKKLPEKIKIIAELRNSSAHINQCSKQKVCDVRKILLEDKMLEIISQL